MLDEYAACFGEPSVPVPIDEIAVDLLGLRVHLVEDLPFSGALYPAERLVCLCASEARESEGRRRFTLAHEVGHWVLHHRRRPGAAGDVHVLHRDHTPGSRDPKEREANTFAAELLMPEGDVRRAFSDGLDVEVAAARFVVSPVAMHWRYFNLALVEDPPPQA